MRLTAIIFFVSVLFASTGIARETAKSYNGPREHTVVKTEFFKDGTGRFAATGVIRLTDRKEEETGWHTLSGTWRNGKESGQVSFSFAPDYSHFLGFWNKGEGTKHGYWVGR